MIMMLALLWLSVSMPFIYASQKAAQEKNTNAAVADEEDSAGNNTNTTEEKTCSNLNTVNEYLHEPLHLFDNSIVVPGHNACHTTAAYTAFHGELLSPPPEFFS
jgi:hypothetical protein